MQAVLYVMPARRNHSLVSLHDGSDGECRALIQCMRRIGPGHCYASSMSPPAVEQVMSAMRVLRGQDGSDRGVKKIQQLRDNANYFRQRLTDMGCSVLGSQDSPVMVSQKQLSSLVFSSKTLSMSSFAADSSFSGTSRWGSKNWGAGCESRRSVVCGLLEDEATLRHACGHSLQTVCTGSTLTKNVCACSPSCCSILAK